MPSGKRRLHSVSGRHNDDRLKNAFGVFRKGIKRLIVSDLYRRLTEIAKVHYTPVTLNGHVMPVFCMHNSMSISAKGLHVFHSTSLRQKCCPLYVF